MPDETSPPLLTEADYESIEGAVMETTRGRWFLAEFARRMRAADTDRMLEVMARLERAVTWRQGAIAGEVAAETAALRAAVRMIAERLQDVVWRLRERNFAGDVCQAVEEETAKLADLARSTGLAIETVRPLDLAADPPQPGPPTPAVPPPELGPTELPRDQRLAALAHIDALTPAEKLALFL
ncbi:MAG: hypothetical protein JO273_25805 [Methylobacteriaceae bacterium]|nr:hypothetical protein [Methylobacteriaceae bacterium]